MTARGAAGTAAIALWVAGLLGGWGCGRPSPIVPEGALLMTQVPVDSRGGDGGVDTLDVRYPAGSRVVFVPRPEAPARGELVVVSEGLHAAGAPVVGPDGREVLFAGKARPGAAWQIYRARLGEGGCRQVTEVAGGAMSPAWLPAGRFVFVSPVPRSDATGQPGRVEVAALYALPVTGGTPERLTHGLVPATDPTVLSDGRILFVSSVPGATGGPGPGTSLFTVNNDGTEVSAFAGQHDGTASVHRPRETPDGRVLFLNGGTGASAVEGRMEQVQTARPFRSRTVVHPQITAPCRAAEPDREGRLLATFRETGPDRGRMSFAVYRLGTGAVRLGEPLYDDPAWHEVEALYPALALRPMGRLSGLVPERPEGVLLCLDARVSDRPWPDARWGAGGGVPGARVRLTCWADGGVVAVLGEAPVLEDGSFMVRVPADKPLGLELVDAGGTVVRRCPPGFWVRPGENRACVGCHEPHNRAPENGRPLAVRRAPMVLVPGPGGAVGEGRSGGP